MLEIESPQILDEILPDRIDDESGKDENVEPWLFFWLGNACLLVFNIAINAIDIYQDITKDINIGNDLNRAYNFPCSIVALILCFVNIRNQKLVFIVSLSSLFLDLCILPIIILVDMSKTAVYWSTMICICISGVFSSFLMSSSFSISTQFSGKSAGQISSGNGLCGVIAAVLRIITKAVFSSKSLMKLSSSFYFFLAAIIILATLIYFIWKLRDAEISAKFIIKDDDSSKKALNLGQMIETIKVVWPLWLSEALDYLITLTLFPGYVSAGNGGIFQTWNPVIITTVFCVFDWVGRYLPSKFMWPSLKYAQWPMLARILFFPIELLSLQKVINFGEPWFTVIMMIPFAITNGYFGTVCMMYGSNHPDLTQEQKISAGFLMTFAINAGILCAMGLTYVMPTPKII